MIRRATTALRATAASALTARGIAAEPGGADLAAAWAAWRGADFIAAARLAQALVPERGDAARHLLVLACHVLGDHRGAVAARAEMSERAARLGELDEPVLWSYAFAGDPAGLAFAEARGLLRDAYGRAEIEVFLRRPMRVHHAGAITLPFSDDRLSPAMPGFAVRINGRQALARLDTGGAWLVMTHAQAAAFGVDQIASRGGAFFALSTGRVGLGLAEMEIGGTRLRDVPVQIVDSLPGTEQFGTLFGVELGPIVGTNILAAFLTTVDGPGRQLLLTPPQDAPAVARHRARLGGEGVPFGVLGDHLTIARARLGAAGERPVFLDSGLVAFDGQGRQAALLMSRRMAHRLAVAPPKGAAFPILSGAAGLAAATDHGLPVHIVANRTWRGFGRWGGIEVAALLSWGYLGRRAWSLDYAARRMWLYR